MAAPGAGAWVGFAGCLVLETCQRITGGCLLMFIDGDWFFWVCSTLYLMYVDVLFRSNHECIRGRKGCKAPKIIQ